MHLRWSSIAMAAERDNVAGEVVTGPTWPCTEMFALALVAPSCVVQRRSLSQHLPLEDRRASIFQTSRAGTVAYGAAAALAAAVLAAGASAAVLHALEPVSLLWTPPSRHLGERRLLSNFSVVDHDPQRLASRGARWRV